MAVTQLREVSSKLQQIGGVITNPFPGFTIRVRGGYIGDSWSDRYLGDCLKAVREGEKYHRLSNLAKYCDLSYSVYEDSPLLDNLHNKLIAGDPVTYYDWYHIYLPEIEEQMERIKDVLWLKGRFQTLYQTISLSLDLALVLYYDVFQQHWYGYFRDAQLNVGPEIFVEGSVQNLLERMEVMDYGF